MTDFERAPRAGPVTSSASGIAMCSSLPATTGPSRSRPSDRGVQRAFSEAVFPADSAQRGRMRRRTSRQVRGDPRRARAPPSGRHHRRQRIIALGAERAIRDTGLQIPRDISVCGYDDLIFSRVSEVPLTTVKQDIKQLCRKTVDVLFERIQGTRTTKRTHRIQPELIIRESTGPCRRRGKEGRGGKP